MKKQTGIWIDSTKAIIVSLEGSKEAVTEVLSELENRVSHDKKGDKGSFFAGQHIDSQKSFDERKKHQINSYLKDVISSVSNADALYIFGPAETKTKLEKKINAEKSTISSKPKSIETADSMTSNQIVAKVKQFYSQK
ncbi:MAG: hypothetical protein ACI9M1_002143 [Porticoccaceae bacterium]|jgi:hypothetical protein